MNLTPFGQIAADKLKATLETSKKKIDLDVLETSLTTAGNTRAAAVIRDKIKTDNRIYKENDHYLESSEANAFIDAIQNISPDSSGTKSIPVPKAGQTIDNFSNLEEAKNAYSLLNVFFAFNDGSSEQALNENNIKVLAGADGNLTTRGSDNDEDKLVLNSSITNNNSIFVNDSAATTDTTNNSSTTKTVAAETDLTAIEKSDKSKPFDATRDSSLISYWKQDGVAQSLAKLGIDKDFVTGLANDDAKENFKAGLDRLSGLNSYLTDKMKQTDNAMKTPEALLGGAYRLTSLAAIVQMVGKNKLAKPTTGEQPDPIRKAVIKALDTTSGEKAGGTDGEKFLDAFLAAKWSDEGQKYVTDVSNGGPGALGKSYDQAKLSEHASLITNNETEATAKANKSAEGWLRMYGNNGVGGRSYEVMPTGDVTERGNASVHTNMPAFAIRWLTKMPTTVDELIALVTKAIPGGNQAAFTKVMEGAKPAIEAALNGQDIANLTSGLLATSIVSVEAVSAGKIPVTINVKNLLERLGSTKAIQSKETLKTAFDGLMKIAPKDNVKIKLDLADTVSWDTEDTRLGTQKVLEKLFNTKNNSKNNTEAKEAAPDYFKASTSNAGTASKSVVVDNTTIKDLTPLNYVLPSNQSFTQDEAKLLMANWLKAKETIFNATISKDKRTELVNKFSTSKYQTEITSMVNKSDNITFNSHEIRKVEGLSVNGDTATASFTIYEPTDGQTDATQTQYKFTFTKTDNGWKIANRVKVTS